MINLFSFDVPALGFGARIPPTGRVSDEFFLNLRPDTPYCFGVNGVLEAYFGALQQVTLYGPTNFSPVINHVARFASSLQDGRSYFVLLILTDGIITDLDLTVAALVRASSLPMSVIIVGVGNEDFSGKEKKIVPAFKCESFKSLPKNDKNSIFTIRFVYGSIWGPML